MNIMHILNAIAVAACGVLLLDSFQDHRSKNRWLVWLLTLAVIVNAAALILT